MSKVKRLQKRAWWYNAVPPSIYHQHSRGDIVCSDALTFLHQLKGGCADIVFLDPPFNLGKQYGSRAASRDRLCEEGYLCYIEQVLLRCCDVLKDGGALYLYHIPRFAVVFANILRQHLEFRHWIAIAMKNGFVRGRNLYPAHYSLLYFTKGEPEVFSRPKVEPPRCRKCNNPIKDYGGYKRFVVDGVNLSDFWDDISPVRHRKYKNRKGNELPVIIPSRVVQISGRRHGVLVDPFAGTGSAAVAAINGGMRFVVADREREACRVMRNRVTVSPKDLR